jgi:hypothetical protein
MTQVGGGVQGVADWRRALGGGTSSSYVAQVGTIHMGCSSEEASAAAGSQLGCAAHIRFEANISKYEAKIYSLRNE